MERSAGAVIFREEPFGAAQGKGSRTLFLLLHYPTRSSKSKKAHWDFPKGHIEKGEEEIDTVKREVKEETGLNDINIIDGFKERIKYYFTAEERTIFKTVIFYLAETKTKNVKISKEHIGFKWLPYKEALKQLTFQKPKDILRKVDNALKQTPPATA